jgi:hypothetical protein
MRKSHKVVLATLCIGALLVLVVGGGAAYWWNGHSSQIREEGARTMARAALFGAATDNEGCLEESLLSFDECDGFLCEVQSNLFLRECLESSSPSEGFCEGVPSEGAILDSVNWSVRECDDLGRPRDSCGRLIRQIQKYCGIARTS